jgi:hypothetical protein
MKLMKVIYILKNISIQEFQHCSESKLIEVMIHKMLPIQFVLSVNLSQIWLMKVIYILKNISNKELQHSLESRLIEVMIHENFRFNSCQLWVWFKLNWSKWVTKWKRFQSKNFNIARNQDWSKWWFIKCFRFNSCQAWIWFKSDW